MFAFTLKKQKQGGGGKPLMEFTFVILGALASQIEKNVDIFFLHDSFN